MIEIELLACHHISDQARAELKRAQCPVHSGVAGSPHGLLIVELQHGGWQSGDRSGLSIWGTRYEIEIISRALALVLQWDDERQGYRLVTRDEDGCMIYGDQVIRRDQGVEGGLVERPWLASDDGLGDIDEHPF